MTRMTAEQFMAMHNRGDGNKGLRALGRLKPGEMNKTEKRYDQYLAGLQIAGQIQWRMFEGIKLRLAEKTFLTVDFAIMGRDGVLEMHDVKGGKGVFMDDARAKIKIAAAIYPFVFKAVYPRAAKDGGGWEEEVF